MKPDGWAQDSQLYHAALVKDASERGQFLAQVCGSDDALRREVESLLAHEETAEQFFAVPALEMAAKVMAEDVRGSLSGRPSATSRHRLLLQAGVPAVDVAKRMGHSVWVRLSTYAHALPDQGKRHAEALASVLHGGWV